MTSITSKLNLPPIEQIGIVVKNLDGAIDHYTNTLGWGPFDRLELDIGQFTYEGQPCQGILKVALSPANPIQIELIEALEGVNPYSDFLREKGEGIQHICCQGVEDLDGMLNELAKEGIEPVFQGTLQVMGFEVRAAYVVGEKTNGVMIELHSP